jgi:hypothetical protein
MDVGARVEELTNGANNQDNAGSSLILFGINTEI